MTAYEELEHRVRRISALQEAAGVLHWDMSTMMPSGGAAARAEQLAALEVTCHEMLTAPRMSDLIAQAGAELDGIEPWRAANLKEIERRWRHATAVPSQLVDAFTRACRHCEMQWREARAKSDYAMVRPALAEVLRLVREVAVAKAEALGVTPYEALLDQFEPGLRVDQVELMFEHLARDLPPLMARVLERQRRSEPPPAPPGPFPREAQERLARQLMEVVGLDFAHARLDVSIHPFCGGVPEDVRITTRYEEADYAGALMGVLHESGHALYERNLPSTWRLQPVGTARGMAVHESQSLLIEMQAGRSRSFFQFLAPLVREAFGGTGPAWETEALWRRAIRVEPGMIRVDADEVTYPAHVILRTRLERALIAGELEVAGLPGAWNDGMRDLLGLVPPNDSQGCLQDIHWFDGAFGYFPTYTLGAIMAAQLFAAARRGHPEIPQDLARGDFSRLSGWLRENVHALGSSLTAEACLIRATGEAPSTGAFLSHLEHRYLEDEGS